MSQRFANLTVSARWLLLAVAAVLVLAAYPASRQVEFDRSIENMFAPEDPLLVPYRKLKAVFGGNEIVLAVYVDPTLLEPDGSGIRRLGDLTGRLRQVPGVRDVLSLAEVDKAVRSFGVGIVDPDSPLARRFRELFESYTHKEHGGTVTAAVACMLVPEAETSVPRRETIDQLREVITEFPSGMLAGEPVMVVDGFRYVEEDGRRLGWATTWLLGLTIILLFRSLRWVVIPVCVVQLALLLTRATLVWSRLRLSMVSSMLTAIVTVVGVATVIHLIVRFRDARAQGAMSPRAAMVHCIAILAAPIFWACATDAVGFASLLVAEVGPVHDFGIMMAIGSLYVMVSAVLVVPGLALLGRFDADPHRAWGEGGLSEALRRLIGWVERRPRTLAGATAGLVVLTTAGVARLDVETDFTRNFRANTPIVRSYQYVEDHLGGAGVWDVIVPAPKSLEAEYLQHVLRFEQRLRDIRVADHDGDRQPALSKVISLADAVEAAQSNQLVALPPELTARSMALVMPTFTAALRGRTEEGQSYLRVMLRAAEQQPAAQKQWLIDEVGRIAAEEFPAQLDPPGAEVTGFFVLLTNLIESMIRDQWNCFGVATAGIAAMGLIAFRSLRLALVSIVPNALPIMMLLGCMGWLGLRINMGAAMIAAVSMGLSVDSSIHYITSFRRARLSGKTFHEAVGEVQQTVGRAMVFSTVALIVGFSALCMSRFVPTIYFGTLVSLSMLGGMFGNLLVLPLLLKWVAWHPRGQPSTAAARKAEC